jgi:dynein assembly factor with WDR repeat domains 1
LTNCAFSKYGDYFATSSYDRTCKIWDSNSGNLVSILTGHRNAVFCLNFSHFIDQTIIATGSFDHTVRLWDLNGKILQNLTGHSAEVTSVKFNPNGTYLCSSSLDNTARVWDI